MSDVASKDSEKDRLNTIAAQALKAAEEATAAGNFASASRALTVLHQARRLADDDG